MTRAPVTGSRGGRSEAPPRAERTAFDRAAFAGLLAIGAVSCGGASLPSPSPAASARATALRPVAPPAPPPVSAPPVDAELAALARAGLASTTSFDVTRSLADEVGGRIVGSPSFDAAVRWGTAKMTELHLSNVHTEPVIARRWERGTESAELYDPAPQRLEIVALGNSPATSASGIVAPVVEVDSLAALEKLPDDQVKGSIVFFNKVMERTRDGSGYGHAVDVRANGPAAAAMKGARAVLVRSITAATDRFAHTGVMRTSFPAGSPYEHVKPLPAGAISVPDAELLHRLLAAHRPVRVKVVLTPRDRGPAPAFNVVGEIPGTTDAASVVLLGAHLDSWDLGTGAQDDAAGCGIVLGAASLLLATHVAPARTVRVVLFAGEENGTFGARAYAKMHAAEADHIVVALEADAGADRVYALRALGDHGPTFSALTLALRPLQIEARPEPAHGGSDIEDLRDLGVPMVDLQQEMSRYFDIHHTKNDVVDRIDRDALAQATTATAIAADILARTGATLGRAPAEEHPAAPLVPKR